MKTASVLIALSLLVAVPQAQQTFDRKAIPKPGKTPELRVPTGYTAERYLRQLTESGWAVAGELSAIDQRIAAEIDAAEEEPSPGSGGSRGGRPPACERGSFARAAPRERHRRSGRRRR